MNHICECYHTLLTIFWEDSFVQKLVVTLKITRNTTCLVLVALVNSFMKNTTGGMPAQWFGWRDMLQDIQETTNSYYQNDIESYCMEFPGTNSERHTLTQQQITTMRFQTGNNSLNGFNTGFKMHRVRKQWETTSGLEVWLSLSFFMFEWWSFQMVLDFNFPLSCCLSWREQIGNRWGP